jgi:hypothetical protein
MFRNLVAILWVASTQLLAQTTGLGRITGTITDASGLVIAGAAVSATNAATDEMRQT